MKEYEEICLGPFSLNIFLEPSFWTNQEPVDLFHIFVLAYPLPKLVFCDPPPLMTSHLGNGLSKKCLGGLEKIRASP